MIWLRLVAVMPLLILSTLAIMPFQALGLWFDLKYRRSLPRYFHRVACFCLNVRVRVHGKPQKARPLLLAVNHASWIDILVLGSVADVVFVAKSEVRDWPVFGFLAKLQKTIFVEREQKRDAGNQVSEIASRMADGEIVVLFPEGTTSDGNRMLDVKSSLFGAASTSADQVPGESVFVQPVAIAYTGVNRMPMGRYHRFLAAWPGSIGLVPHLIGLIKANGIDVDVSFGDAERFTKGDNRKRLAAKMRDQIREMLHFSLRGGWR
jgi:1-acyl-sn-glycerol-3-phosphate acyltransferase